MPNFSKLDTTIEIGVMILGKYTFPKIAALALNVSEVPFKQEVK